MDIQTAAIITVSNKLELLDRLLEKRIERASLNTVSPTLSLMEKVYELGESRRLAANLAVMYHRLECALTPDEIECIRSAAACKYGFGLDGKNAARALKKARRVLDDLGVNKFTLEEYEKLPLYRAECAKIKRISERKGRALNSFVSAEAKSGNAIGTLQPT